jgi:histidine decarboxylase
VAWRHKHAFTVVIKAPSPAMIRRWALATTGEWSHIVCVPGVTTEVIDRFVDELVADLRSEYQPAAPAPTARRRWWQRQRVERAGWPGAVNTGLPPVG